MSLVWADLDQELITSPLAAAGRRVSRPAHPIASSLPYPVGTITYDRMAQS